MSEYIYTSEKVMPYIYWVTHKVTGEFYIGSSSNQNQKLPSHLHFGTKYKTSSKKVKAKGFENFDWIIIAEIFDRKETQYFENLIIEEHIKNPLCLNGHSYNHWNTVGQNPFRDKTLEQREIISKKIANAYFRTPKEVRTERWLKRSIKNANKSIEEKKIVSENIRAGWTNKSEEEKNITCEKRKRTHQNKSPEEKAEAVRLQLETKNKKTLNEKEEYSKKLSSAYHDKSDDQKATEAKSKSNGWHNKPKEEKELLNKKRSDRMLGKPQGPQQKAICPHCGLEGGISAMKHYHFENCKKKGKI